MENGNEQKENISRRKLLAKIGMTGAAIAGSSLMLPWAAANGESGEEADCCLALADGSDPLKGDALIAVKQPLAGSVLRTQHDKNADAISVKDFGAVCDGVADDTVALQAAIDALAENGCLIVPNGAKVKFTAVTIGTPGIMLTGGGELKGKLIVRPATAEHYIGLRIDGIQFTTTGTAIELKRGDAIRIANCTFTNSAKAIHIFPNVQDYDVVNHCVSSVIITNNHFRMVDYALYIETDPAVIALPNFDIWKIAGDVTFSLNHVKVAKISHIYADHIDGMVVSGNTLFHYGFGSGVMTKQHNIRVNGWGSLLVIADNQFFESGLEAIYINNTSSISIVGNHIIQPGQANLSSAIKLTYSGAGESVPGTRTSFANITGNLIYGPTKYGIELHNQSYAKVTDNMLYMVTSAYWYYGDSHGNAALSTVTHYGVAVTSDPGVTPAEITASNFCTLKGLEKNYSYNYKPQNELSRLDVTTSITSLPNGYRQLNLVFPTATTVTHIADGYEGQQLIILSYNGNATIQNNAQIRLADAANYTLPAFSTLVLHFYGMWIEISRTKLTP